MKTRIIQHNMVTRGNVFFKSTRDAKKLKLTNVNESKRLLLHSECAEN